MVSIRPSISCSSSPLSNPFGTVRSALIIIVISITHSFFSSQVRSKYFSFVSFCFVLFVCFVFFFLFFSFLFLFFSPGGPPVLFLFSLGLIFKPELDELKIPENAMRLIFQDRFLFVHIPFSSIFIIICLFAMPPWASPLLTIFLTLTSFLNLNTEHIYRVER